MKESKPRVLIVEDERYNINVLVNILKSDYKIIVAKNGEAALKRAISANPPDLILLDIMMPEMDGYEVCTRLKADAKTRDIPIIFITALSDTIDEVKGLELGAVDYITKPVQPDTVLARVQTHLTIQQLQRQLQEQNARFQALSEATFEGIIIHDNKRIIDVNHMIEKIFRYHHAELIDKAFLDVIAPEDHATMSAHIRAGDEHPYEVKGIRKDASGFPIEIQAKMMPYQGRDVSVTAVRDLSWQKTMETENAQLHHENLTLKANMKNRYKFGDIIGRSAVMQEVYELITKASATDANVVIYGESGTGKDLVAQTIHTLSKRREKSFVPVNCGSIQETLFESEFFGYRKGAFTGALRDKSGFFDVAHKGTLFLDEVAELSPAMQVKLLRAIEGSGYTPVGDHAVKHADVRIIAATNKNVVEQIKQGMMREDFFYRINVITIHVPPLRERKEDIPLLIEHFLKQYTDDSSPRRIPGKILESLYYRDWPGNIRQLQNVLQRYLTLERLDFHDDIHGAEEKSLLYEADPEGIGLRDAMEEFEKRFILKVLEQNQGHRGKTAETLDIPPRTLRRKLERYRIK